MTYSQQIPLTYGNQQPLSYDLEVMQSTPMAVNNESVYVQPKQKNKINPAAKAGIIGVVGGAAIGGAIGALRNPYIKNGVPTDTFTKAVYKKYIKKAAAEERDSYGQIEEVLNKINKTKNADELKVLLNNNPKAANELASAPNKTSSEFISTISDKNLGSNKETIKTKLEAAKKLRHQETKNKIQDCWDGSKKKFVKSSGTSNNLFSSIKKSMRKVKLGQIGKFAAIGAAVKGALLFVGYKIYEHKKQSS